MDEEVPNLFTGVPCVLGKGLNKPLGGWKQKQNKSLGLKSEDQQQNECPSFFGGRFVKVIRIVGK